MCNFLTQCSYVKCLNKDVCVQNRKLDVLNNEKYREDKDAYPMGGVWPSPFSSMFLLTCSLDMETAPVLFTNKRAADEAPAFKSTRKHKASTVAMANLQLQPKNEYCIDIIIINIKCVYVSQYVFVNSSQKCFSVGVGK